MILYDMCHLKVYQKVPRFSAATFVHVLQTPEKSIMTKYDDSFTLQHNAYNLDGNEDCDKIF